MSKQFQYTWVSNTVYMLITCIYYVKILQCGNILIYTVRYRTWKTSLTYNDVTATRFNILVFIDNSITISNTVVLQLIRLLWLVLHRVLNFKVLRSFLALKGWIHGSNNEDLSKRQIKPYLEPIRIRPKHFKTKGGTLG